MGKRKERTLFFQEDPTFGNHDGDVTVDETFTVIVSEGNGDIGVFDANVEGNTEDSLGLGW